jgi:UDP-2-acetamido-2-deoxy-ribo-hexuluronate aminotransferase
MKKIQMVDLGGQYDKIKSEIDNAVLEVVRSTKYINGPEVQEFGKELEAYLGVGHVIPCANGTDALQVAMMALGLQPGDEVITTAFTFVATAEVIALLGLKPVFVDVNLGTFNIDPSCIEEAITTKTRAIVPVHLFGQCANMQEVSEIANKNNLFVIEDNAQAIGADFICIDGSSKKAGTIGNFGCTSFFPSKNLGCYGDGGALFTNDNLLAEKARSIANHGMTKRYYYDYVGANSRLDSIQAAILRVKLRQLDNYARARQQAASFYDKAFANNQNLSIPKRASFSTHVFHQYTLVTNNIDRGKLQEHLSAKEIPAMIYYPVPLHRQKAYLDFCNPKDSLPITEDLCNKVISLPMHTELDQEQLDYITTSVLEFVNK